MLADNLEEILRSGLGNASKVSSAGVCKVVYLHRGRDVAGHSTNDHHLLISRGSVSFNNVRCCIADPSGSGKAGASKLMDLHVLQV